MGQGQFREFSAAAKQEKKKAHGALAPWASNES
jgi:hypothetical protein